MADEFEEKKALVGGAVRSSLPHHFRMSWTGDKYPTGATIGSDYVEGAQGGIVFGCGLALGYYIREIDCGGPEGTQQQIRISSEHADVTPPPGGKVEDIYTDKSRGR